MRSPTPNIEGRLVALGPFRRDLIATYAPWFNDFETLQTLNATPRPVTFKQEPAWYERQAADPSSMHPTVHELRTLRPVGTAKLARVDRRNRTADFAAMIGEHDLRGRGFGAEAILLTLRCAVPTLGLHNVRVRVFGSNHASLRVHEKAGLCEIGRRRECRRVGGRGYDEVWMRYPGITFDGKVVACNLSIEEGPHA